MNESERKAIESLLKELQRKVNLTKGSLATAKGTNKDYVQMRKTQVSIIQRLLKDN